MVVSYCRYILPTAAVAKDKSVNFSPQKWINFAAFKKKQDCSLLCNLFCFLLLAVSKLNRWDFPSIWKCVRYCIVCSKEQFGWFLVFCKHQRLCTEVCVRGIHWWLNQSEMVFECIAFELTPQNGQSGRNKCEE